MARESEAFDTELCRLLRASFDALAALERFCDPEQGMQPQGIAVENAAEELIDNFDEHVRGRCEQCRRALLIGELGHTCLDGEPLFCADHAYTWREVQESYDEGRDAELISDFKTRLEAHMKVGGSIDDKMVWPL